jgi:hypothetical protein
MAAQLDPDRRRDHVWRHSYDADSPEAKPWVYVLDRSREAWTIVKNALNRTCREDVTEETRLARSARLKGERPAPRLRVGDERVLEAYLDDYHPDTGELFTAQATIAAELGIGLATVNAALQRLRDRGYLNWVRRSKVTEEDGPGWRRKQTSNAYFFDWKKSLSPRAWSRFWQLVLAGLGRIGKAAIAKTAALFTRVIAPRLLGRPRCSPAPGPRLATRVKRDSSSRIYPGQER